MYRRLIAGEFGNRTPQYLSVSEWMVSADRSRFQTWGIRSATVSAHPACKMHVLTDDVIPYCLRHFPDGPNISPMVDRAIGVTAWFNVVELIDRLVVEGIEWPRIDDGWDWRNSMNDPGRVVRYDGTAARHVLARHLNENSLADLKILLENYPDHVIELSALAGCIGTVPDRNAVVWEVRHY